MATHSVPEECKLERYFAVHEFNTKYLLCCSDVDAMDMQEVLDAADPESRKLWNSLKLSYTESNGHPLLRAEAAKLHGVNADEVLVIVPQEGIYIAMHCLIKYLSNKFGGPFHAVATYPAYQSLYENLKTVNCDLDYWIVEDTENGWNFDMDKLRSLLKPSTRLLVVNFPHNPTGFIPSSEQWQAIVTLCKERDIFLFSDEMYRLTNNDGTEPLPSAAGFYDNAISLFGMSKTFALPGLRLGWLATKNCEIMEMMASFKDYTTICASGPSELLSLMALRNTKSIVERTQQILQPNLVVLDEFFVKYPDLFKWHQPTAGTTGFLQLKSWLLNFNEGGASGFCKELLKESQVLLLPGNMYDFSDQYVRLSFGRKDMPEALEQLEKFIQTRKPTE